MRVLQGLCTMLRSLPQTRTLVTESFSVSIGEGWVRRMGIILGLAPLTWVAHIFSARFTPARSCFSTCRTSTPPLLSSQMPTTILLLSTNTMQSHMLSFAFARCFSAFIMTQFNPPVFNLQPRSLQDLPSPYSSRIPSSDISAPSHCIFCSMTICLLYMLSIASANSSEDMPSLAENLVGLAV